MTLLERVRELHDSYHACDAKDTLAEMIRELECGEVDIIIEIRAINHKLEKLEAFAMAISPQVQALLDAIKQNSDLVASVDAGFKAEATQITALQDQVAALQATVAAGGTLSADDIAALASGLTQLGQTNATLQADVPANTTPAAPAAGSVAQ